MQRATISADIVSSTLSSVGFAIRPQGKGDLKSPDSIPTDCKSVGT